MIKGDGDMNTAPMETKRETSAIRRAARAFAGGTAAQFKEIYVIFKNGDFKTRLSFVFMGAGSLLRGQIVKGFLYLGFGALVILYYLFFGWNYLKDFGTLGENAQVRVWDEALQIYKRVPGDNSMLILLFSVVSIAIIVPALLLWRANLRSAYRAQKRLEDGGKLNSFRNDLRSLLDGRFHITLLSLPMLSLTLFTVLPIVFMVLIAFTNFDKTHQPPGSLFTWVGLTNVTDVFFGDALKSHTFYSILGWTFVWAILATFTNYILGTILAMMINKKGIRFKKMWRTIFVTTIAIPQFVSLMLVARMFTDTGVVNVLLQKLNLVQTPIPFLTDPTMARILVVVVNMWVGIPYTMLMVSGILMNIPSDLYESAAIDGAGPVRSFFSITIPYMLFVTGPYMITTFVGNINNFNVIYLLTAGGPKSLEYYQAGKTDLLVTWLYKLTVDDQNYALASTVGIFIFMIVSILSLTVYNSTSSVKKEDAFQ